MLARLHPASALLVSVAALLGLPVAGCSSGSETPSSLGGGGNAGGGGAGGSAGTGGADAGDDAADVSQPPDASEDTTPVDAADGGGDDVIVADAPPDATTVSCVFSSDCPGVDSYCQVRACDANVCGFTISALGTELPGQAPGDCKTAVCDGAGRTVVQAAPSDIPDDNNPCTVDACSGTTPTHTPRAVDTPCGVGLKCNAAGTCAGCTSAADCPGQIADCSRPTCIGGSACGLIYTGAGARTSSQLAGDCHANVCDGAGAVASSIDDADVPVDGNPCTLDTCNGGVPANPPVGAGAGCGAGMTCDGQGHCGSGDVALLRVGSGAAILSGSAADLYVERRHADGALVSTLTLPQTSGPTGSMITLTATKTTEGMLHRSLNGAYLTLAGYGAAVGTPSVATTASATIPRVVARIDGFGNVDTTTTLSVPFSGTNVRSALTADGSGFWVAGDGTGLALTSAAVVWVPFGSGSSWSGVVTAPNVVRVMGSFGAQLYASSLAGTQAGVFAIGSGLPTAAGQTATELPGMFVGSVGVPSPYGFVLFDRSAAVAGVDTLYLADDRSVANGGGLQKWSYDGGSWTLVTTYNLGLGTGLRGLTGQVVGGNVVLFATTADALPSLVKLTDDGSATPIFSVLATASAGTVFRGVAFWPN